MKKDIHPKMQNVSYKCASCSSEFVLKSTIKQNSVLLDVCSNCHPFISGNTTEQVAKGRSEKLSSKFAAGLKAQPAKREKNKKTNKKIVSDLNNL